MYFSQDRNQLRHFYIDTWRKYQAGVPLEPIERVVVEVVAEHPEYHGLLENADKALERDYSPGQEESNPFLHMGLHIALREQIGTDRPVGILAAYTALAKVAADPHGAEHAMMECLAETLWRAQRDGTSPDEKTYLRDIDRVVRKTKAGRKA